MPIIRRKTYDQKQFSYMGGLQKGNINPIRITLMARRIQVMVFAVNVPIC